MPSFALHLVISLFDSLDLAFEARLLGVKVDQAGQRDQQAQLADDGRGGCRFGFAVIEPALRFGARKECRSDAANFSDASAIAALPPANRSGIVLLGAIFISLRMRRTWLKHGFQPFDLGIPPPSSTTKSAARG